MTGSVIRALVVLALIGLVVVEGAAVVFARLRAQDLAESAAIVGEASYRASRSVSVARREAELDVFDADPRAEVRSFEVSSGGTVTVMVVKPAHTLIIHRLSFLRDFALAHATAEARPPP